jgi:hypothetical protein
MDEFSDDDTEIEAMTEEKKDVEIKKLKIGNLMETTNKQRSEPDDIPATVL